MFSAVPYMNPCLRKYTDGPVISNTIMSENSSPVQAISYNLLKHS